MAIPSVEDLLAEYNPWWSRDYSFPAYINRPSFEQKLYDLIDKKGIVLLTGLRRVGKTTLLKRAIQQLLEQGTPAKHILYVSFDDYAVKDLSMIEVIDRYYQMQRLSYDVKAYVFLDEVTYIPEFHRQLKNLYDRERVKVFASSSSATALRDQRGFLTGREWVIEVKPLDFEEFLLFRGLKINSYDVALRKSYFEEYLQHGGMPEYVLDYNREYLTSLVDEIIAKDIVMFHKLRSPEILKDYFNLLMERAGKQISLNKVANILAISLDSARRYLQMFEDTFLIYLVSRHGKTNETIMSSKKVYAADLGIRNLFTGFRDKGALFENYIFNKIRALRPRYIYQDGNEIDFMTENNWLIEVKYGKEMNAKQQALFEKMKAKEKLIISSLHDLDKLDHLLLT